MKKLCLFAVVLLVAGCASNGGYYDGGNSYQKLSQSLDDIHSTAQKSRRRRKNTGAMKMKATTIGKTEPESVGNSGVMTLNTKANG